MNEHLFLRDVPAKQFEMFFPALQRRRQRCSFQPSSDEGKAGLAFVPRKRSVKSQARLSFSASKNDGRQNSKMGRIA